MRNSTGNPGNYTTRISLCVFSTGNSLETIKVDASWRAEERVLDSLWNSNISSTTVLRTQLQGNGCLISRGVMNLSTFTLPSYRPFTSVIPTIRHSSQIPYGDSLEVDEIDRVYNSIVVRNL